MKISVAAILVILAAFLTAQVIPLPAWAQGAGPIAAPTGPAAQTQALAPPPGVAESNAMPGEAGGGFSIVSMFLRADIVVKVVMVMLLLASLWSWTIIFNKLVILSTLKRKARRFEKIFWSG